MKWLSQILHIIDLINEWLGNVVGFLVILLTGVICYDTLMRYLFASPNFWAMEVNQTITLTLVCLGGGYTLLHGGHVKVEFLVMHLNRWTRTLIDLLSYQFITLFCIILIRYGLIISIKAFSIGEINPEGGIEYPMWPIYMLIPISGVLMGLQALAKSLRSLIILLTGENRLQSKVVRGEGGIRG